MATSRKAALAVLASATLLAGCATGPYYDDYGYGYGSRYGYGYGYGDPYYYAPGYYYGPSIGLGLTYSDRDYRRHDHRHRDWRRDRHDRDGTRDRSPDWYNSPGGTRDAERDPSYSPG